MNDGRIRTRALADKRIRVEVDELEGITIHAPLDVARPDLYDAVWNAIQYAQAIASPNRTQRAVMLGREAFDLRHGTWITYRNDDERDWIRGMKRDADGLLPWPDVATIMEARHPRTADAELDERQVRRWAAHWRFESSDEALERELASRDAPDT